MWPNVVVKNINFTFSVFILRVYPSFLRPVTDVQTISTRANTSTVEEKLFAYVCLGYFFSFIYYRCLRTIIKYILVYFFKYVKKV